jgi:hydrogenase maturation protein HypF
MSVSIPKTEIAWRVLVEGRVQGIGFRPAIVRRARELGLSGWVRNTSAGVEVHIEGASEALDQFVEQCHALCPPSGAVQKLSVTSAPLEACLDFDVHVASEPEGLATAVPQDLVVCRDCRAEVADSDNRRAGYLFTTCTQCGPRYSLIETMPFERGATTMQGFPLCAKCRAEFSDPHARRFHAQTIACAECGPQLAREIETVVAALRAGRIVALKGLGGYQLLCDASNPASVARLRERKCRPAKPLAVLVESLEQADQLAELSPQERKALASSAGPIVIVRQRPNRLVPAIAPGLSTVGLMLPTTPLHFALARAVGPLVATSGNREGEPLAGDAQAAVWDLTDVADEFLHHNRPIRRPIDDSVIRVIAERAVTIRLARGLAPLTLNIPAEQAVLALGGQQKVALALSNGQQAILGPHVGDLDTLAARQRFANHVDDLLELFQAQPSTIVHDLHPDYYTTAWAESFAAERSLRRIAVQHHHAHVVAGMIEPGWLGQTVLGVAWDGTGYGTDGTIWGGEFLQATARGFRRVAHLRSFGLPGGAAAIREPWRVASTILRDVREWDSSIKFQIPEERQLEKILHVRGFAPLTTSAGRFFDAVAAMILPLEVLGGRRAGYEGHFAVLLEEACDTQASGSYPFPLSSSTSNEPRVLDWRPLVAGVLQDLIAGTRIEIIAMRFHRSLAHGIAAVCAEWNALPVVLCGGVFQNRVLVELLADEFRQRMAPVAFPGVIPANDGGLAAGQLAIGLALLREERACV